MHLVGNMDNNCGNCLTIGGDILKKVTEALAASQNPSTVSYSASWNLYMTDRNEKNFRLIRQLGVRFSSKPRNAVRILYFWDHLLEFIPITAPELLRHFKLPELDDAKLELLALCWSWYFVLLPLWCEIAACDIEKTIPLLRECESILNYVEKYGIDKDICKPALNKLLRTDFNDEDSVIRPCSEDVFRSFVSREVNSLVFKCFIYKYHYFANVFEF